MKKLIIIFLIVLTLILISCLVDSEDCPCTMEYRMITVVVIDEQSNIVKDLTTTVKDRAGKQYDFSEEDAFFEGHHIVMSERYLQDFSTIPKRIIFTGMKDTLSVTAEYMINTDPCNCHIEKISGPDTLVLK